MKWFSLLLLLAVSFIILAVYNGSRDGSLKYDETKEMIVLRKVVHQLLLSSGDSVSRILPVQQISANEFHVLPEKPLSISPDSFINIVSKTIKEGKLLRPFTASVVKCQGEEVVYGFAASPLAKDNVASCQGRKLPEDCYYLSFIFSPEEKSFLTGSYFYVAAAAIALLALLFVWRNKKNKNIPTLSVPAKAVNENGTTANGIQIGKYLFNTEQQYLELDGEKTALTVKESKVLFILANALNTTIERELLQKEVWESEGVIVTRSLDMFISKLRKKLSSDDGIRIMNVHGKGYKLSVNDSA